MRKRRYIFLLSIIVILCFCGKKGDPIPKRLADPLKIQDLTGEIKDGVFFLSFSLPQIEIDGFKLLRSCGNCGNDFEPLKDILFAGSKGYSIFEKRVYFYDSGLIPGLTYKYKIIPIKGNMFGPSSNIVSITWEELPSPPQEVYVTVDDRKVQFEWNAREDLFYNVYRFDNGYPLFPLNSQPLKFPLFVDRNVLNGRTYTYEIRALRKAAVDIEGKGKRIVAVPNDKTAPLSPKGLRVEKKSDGIRVLWDKNTENDLVGYNLYRIEGSSIRRLNRELLREESFFDRELPDSRHVSYFVTAVDDSGNESEPSREIIIFLKE